jgi:hypothetical protein
MCIDFLKRTVKIAFLYTGRYPHRLLVIQIGIGTSIKNLAVGLVAAFNLLRMRVIWFMGKISAVFLKKNVT